MSPLASKKFVIALSDSSESSLPRASRRIIINADVAKAAKLCAGDVVALSSSGRSNSLTVSSINVIRAWPVL